MKRKHAPTSKLIFVRPESDWVKWQDIETMFVALGAAVSERERSRIGTVLFGEVRVFHGLHLGPDTGKGAASSIRKWFESHEVRP